MRLCRASVRPFFFLGMGSLFPNTYLVYKVFLRGIFLLWLLMQEIMVSKEKGYFQNTNIISGCRSKHSKTIYKKGENLLYKLKYQKTLQNTFMNNFTIQYKIFHCSMKIYEHQKKVYDCLSSSHENVIKLRYNILPLCLCKKKY